MCIRDRCDAALYYCDIDEFKKNITELRRVLKKNGVMRVYTISSKNFNSKQIKTHSIKIRNSWEKNLIVTLLSKNDIRKFFTGFKNIQIGIDEFNFINYKKKHSYWVITAKKL